MLEGIELRIGRIVLNEYNIQTLRVHLMLMQNTPINENARSQFEYFIETTLSLYDSNIIYSKGNGTASMVSYSFLINSLDKLFEMAQTLKLPVINAGNFTVYVVDKDERHDCMAEGSTLAYKAGLDDKEAEVVQDLLERVDLLGVLKHLENTENK